MKKNLTLPTESKAMNTKDPIIRKKEQYKKTDYMEMWIEDNVFFGIYADGIVIDEAVAKALLKEREAICNNVPYLTFWDCRGVNYWTREARTFQSTDKNYRLMKAGAVVYKESNVANVIINFFYKITPPSIPTKFFSTEEAALKWLKGLKIKG